MKVYNISQSDIHSMKRWVTKAKNRTAIGDLPKLMFAVPGVAVMALRRCEGGIGIIDSMATNSLVSSKTRHKALQALYRHMFKLMRTMDLQGLIGFTTDAGALERAKSYGFKQLPHTTLSYTRKN